MAIARAAGVARFFDGTSGFAFIAKEEESISRRRSTWVLSMSFAILKLDGRIAQ